MIAIVIPYFKIEFFEVCLESLANQTNKNFKVYIGNDGSPDAPNQLIDRYRAELEIEYYAFSTNLGSTSLVSHWERCINLINDEEWLMILGDDDLLEARCIENFYRNLNYIEKKKINVVRFSTIVVNSSGESISKKFLHPEIENSVDSLFRKFSGTTRSSLSEYVFRTSRFKKVGFRKFPLAWHTDDLLILECSNYDAIFTINTTNVLFRNSGKNITSIQDNLLLKNKASFDFFLYLLTKSRKYFDNKQISTLVDQFHRTYENDKKHLSRFINYCQVLLINNKLSKLRSLYKSFFQF